MRGNHKTKYKEILHCRDVYAQKMIDFANENYKRNLKNLLMIS